jgi:adenylate cyclase
VLAGAGRVDEAAVEWNVMLREAAERNAPLVVRQTIADAARFGVTLTLPETSASDAPAVAPAETTEKMVTVMFADVRGYTSMTRQTAPAEMHQRMTSFYRWARTEIERRQGMVDRYAGDAVMASWNTGTSTLDHTVLAVETAIALQDKAALMDLPVGVGIAVGAALVGRMTGGDNVDVIGETTNLAARLQAQASSGEIALSEDAYRRARAAIDKIGLKAEERTLALKGYDEAVRGYVVTR